VNFALTDEQEFLTEAARGTLTRFATVEAARGLLEGQAAPDLWPAACEAGWPGLLVSEEHGGAGLDALDAMLVFSELGRVLARVPLLGHLPATYLLDKAGAPADLLEQLASGEARAAFVPARPPSDVEARWTVEPRRGLERAAAPRIDESGLVTGTVAWVPDAPGADALVVAATDEGGEPRAVLVQAGASVEEVVRYDATRSLGHVELDGVPGSVLEDVGPGELAGAWYLAQCLLGAEALGAVERLLEVATQYAKERHTFGRPIGSYQAIKHQLVEILRRLDNARSLMYYAGWAGQDAPAEFPLAASAFRFVAGEALDVATRTNINVHGGIGATWEHDAPLYFRRAQLLRRLLGGNQDGADRVAGVLFAEARAVAASGEALY
jgi:alkylation response protein AidB-like acyl-CoA dehydrogenase